LQTVELELKHLATIAKSLCNMLQRDDGDHPAHEALEVRSVSVHR